MRIKISHLTEYHYDAPVEFSLQRLRLTPQNLPSQTILSWKAAVGGATIEASYKDHFGNLVELFRPQTNESLIRIHAEGEVETVESHGVFGTQKGFVPLWLYLRETKLTRSGPHVKNIAQKISGNNELEKMHDLMDHLGKAILYRQGETGINTTAEQALEHKSGVCQDHAHAFLSVARIMGIPARYVSGYLLNGETMQTASHAWAEAHIPDLGWVGFDAANNICPGENYIRLAHGLDYIDAAPVSGMRNGNATETMNVKISVEQQSQS